MELKVIFQKYNKAIIIVLFILFCFKSIQGCARKSALRRSEIKHTLIQDSLKNVIIKKDSLIKELNFDIKTYKIAAQAAEDKAKSVQSAVEKLKANTTIKIENISKDEEKDKNK